MARILESTNRRGALPKTTLSGLRRQRNVPSPQYPSWQPPWSPPPSSILCAPHLSLPDRPSNCEGGPQIWIRRCAYGRDLAHAVPPAMWTSASVCNPPELCAPRSRQGSFLLRVHLGHTPRTLKHRVRVTLCLLPGHALQGGRLSHRSTLPPAQPKGQANRVIRGELVRPAGSSDCSDRPEVSSGNVPNTSLSAGSRLSCAWDFRRRLSRGFQAQTDEPTRQPLADRSATDFRTISNVILLCYGTKRAPRTGGDTDPPSPTPSDG